MARMYSLTVRNRAGAVVLATAVVGIGIVLVTVGFALLAALAVAGGVFGTGYAIYNRLRGRPTALPPNYGAMRQGLDPSAEVRPVEPPTIRRLDRGDDSTGAPE